MTFAEIKQALLSSDVEIPSADIAALSLDEISELQYIAGEYRSASRQTPVPAWARNEGLSSGQLLSIAENYEEAVAEHARLTPERVAA